MIRAPLLVLAVALLVSPAALAATGKVGDNYVRIVTEPDFQYHTDEDVRIPLQVQAVQNGVPGSAPVRVYLRTENGGEAITIPGGQASLNGGISPYPSVTYLNFGRLAAGLYRVLVQADSGGLSGSAVLEFGVTYPPECYHASLDDGKAKAGVFRLKACTPGAEFAVTVYQEAGGRVVLESRYGDNLTVDVPYLIGQKTYVEVCDEFGWCNYENRRHDFLTGRVSYLPWSWDPDYKESENAREDSLWTKLGGGIILALATGALFLSRRYSNQPRKRDNSGESDEQ